MWNEIITENDIKVFMETIYGFHDSCLKEFKYVSGAYSDEKIMHVLNDKRILKVIFQGNIGLYNAIEMDFIGLKRLNMFPILETHTCEILDATLILKNGCIYWCDSGGLTEDDLDDYQGTLICASKVRWRPADEYIGQKEVYVARE